MVASVQHLYQTIVQFDKTIVSPRKCATGSIHGFISCYCPLVGILFKVLKIQQTQCISQCGSPEGKEEYMRQNSYQNPHLLQLVSLLEYC